MHGTQRRRLVQVDGPLGDVHGQVADPLQIDDDLQGSGDEAQIARCRLAQHQQAPADLVDLDLQPVHLAVGVDHALGQGAVALGQRAHAGGDLGFHLAPEAQELVAQVVELRIVRLVSVSF